MTDTERMELVRLRHLLGEAKLQIEYLHEKFRATGSGNTVLARIEDAQSRESKPRLWRHVKRGTVYEEIGTAEVRTNFYDILEGDRVVIYRGDDGKLWARPKEEFEDGRFVEITP